MWVWVWVWVYSSYTYMYMLQFHDSFSQTQDFTFLDTLSHFDRERIPERVVHAKGAGKSTTERYTVQSLIQDTLKGGHLIEQDIFGCPIHPVFVCITTPEIRTPH